MESLTAYWDYFVSVEKTSFFGLAEGLRQLNLGAGWYASMVALFCLFGLEIAMPWRKQQRKLRAGLATDLFYLIFNTLFLSGLFGTAVTMLLILLFIDLLAVFGITHQVAIELAGMQMWARFLLLFLVGDFIGWCGHWLLHRVKFLWAFHKIHHSSKELDVWNAQRFHVGELIFWPVFNYFPLGLIGWPPGEVFAYSVIGSLLSTYSHANIRIPLGPLKYIINNPQFHIWHHSADIDARKSANYGDALSMWDYLLGTAYLPPDRDADRLGFNDIDAYPTSYLGQLIQPYIEIASSIRNKLKLAG